MSQQSATSKDAALRAIGRTVVNFQRLEHNLKLAARFGPVQGTIPKIQRDIGRRCERAETLTLGQAIQAWLRFCADEIVSTTYTPDLFDISVQTTFSMGEDTESRRKNAAALDSLLETRNALIHGRLAHFAWDSAVECDQLVAELDKVNDAIAAQIDYIGSLLATFSSLCQEHALAMEAELTKGLASMPTPARDA